MYDSHMIFNLHHVFKNYVARWVRTVIIYVEIAEMNLFDMAPKGINSREFSNSILLRKMIVTITEKTLSIRNFQ